jgi:hypothetical protein
MFSHARAAVLLLLLGVAGAQAQGPFPPAHVGVESYGLEEPGAQASGAPALAPGAALPGGCGGACGEATSFYSRLEYLLWSPRGDPVPPLVSSGTPTSSGALGRGGSLLFGGDRLDDQWEHGGRLTVGVANCGGGAIGIEGDFFFLGGHTTSFSAASNGDVVLARPFFNAQTLQTDALPLATPGLSRGAIQATTSTGLLGAGFRIERPVWQGGAIQVEALVGYRFLRLEDRIDVAEASMTGTGPTAPTTTVSDRFETTNSFHGADLGAVTSFERGPWGVELTTKVALGFNHEFVAINGASSSVVPGQSITTGNGGLLAAPTNTLPTLKNANGRFAVVPELGVTVHYDPMEHVRLTAGYTLLYWDGAARAGEQIDPAVNISQLTVTTAAVQAGTLTGRPRPLFFLHESEYWAQGLSLGLELSY